MSVSVNFGKRFRISTEFLATDTVLGENPHATILAAIGRSSSCLPLQSSPLNSRPLSQAKESCRFAFCPSSTTSINACDEDQ